MVKKSPSQTCNPLNRSIKIPRTKLMLVALFGRELESAFGSLLSSLSSAWKGDSEVP